MSIDFERAETQNYGLAQTRVDTWQALHYLAFSIIFIRKHF